MKTSLRLCGMPWIATALLLFLSWKNQHLVAKAEEIDFGDFEEYAEYRNNRDSSFWDFLTGRRPIVPSFQCSLKLFFLQYDINNFDRYDVYYRDDSTFTLAEAGRYVGPEDIREYVQYANSLFNPFFATGPDETPAVHFRRFNSATGNCEFLITLAGTYEANPELVVAGGRVRSAIMTKLFYSYQEDYVVQQSVYYSPAWLDFYFGFWLDADPVREYLCQVITDCAADGRTMDPPSLTTTECRLQLDALPLVDNPDTRTVVGRSQGCRSLHGVFATTNPSHCAHVALTPTADGKGRTLCQDSTLVEIPPVLPTDLFDETDFQLLRDRAVRENLDPEIQYLYTPP